MNAHIEPPLPPVRTTCPYCGVGCGVVARPDGRGGATVEGDPEHPSNFGRLCSKGSALGETLGLDGRLLHPMVDGRRATWDAALERVSQGFAETLARYGPDSVAFYLSGQLLTEDYYVANKLMKGFLGSANVDTNSRLCMASSVAGHRRAFGSDTVPGCYQDLDEADLIVLVGSNAAWCHPVLFRRMLDARERRGTKIVVVDPRRTATGDEADLFLPAAPGTDAALFDGLLVHLAATGALDRVFVADHTTGFAEAVERARALAPTAAAAARTIGLPDSDVEKFFALFRATERVVTCFSQGVNQSVRGTDTVNAVVNCHLATGRIGRPGMGPLSLTGQPNAMGGREVGGLANALAAHMGFSPEEVDRVRRFWGAPRMAFREGLKAVALFEAVAKGKVKALWVMATNPAVSLPDADAARDALRKLDLLVVSENVAANDTVSRGAHVLLPAAAWGEKDGTVTNSERRVSRQRAFLPLPGEARPDWRIVAEVAKRMGFAEAFAYGSAADVFREHAALSAFENGGARDFDIGGLADLSDEDYDALEPVQWPCPSPARGVGARESRFFADGRFFTPDRKARFVAPARPAAAALSEEYPFRLNTGRIRDQWHTMTRTGRSPRLGAHRPAPFVELAPADAARLGLADGDLARVSTAHGAAVLEVAVETGQRPGSLFAPIHWSGETASAGRVGALVHPLVDPVSGQPDAKATPAAIAPAPMRLRGFMLSRRALPVSFEWWARAAVEGGAGTLFATNQTAREVADAGAALFPDAELVEFADAAQEIFRCAAFRDGQLDGVLFVGPAAAQPQWEAAKTLLAQPDLVAAGRRLALSGQPPDGLGDLGPTVCACFGVGLSAIRDAVVARAAASPEEIGHLLRAGTNCGSCVPEMKRIIARELAPQAG
ncbi:MAG TPA: molybdopterin-dependent oxidoreductase [Beijerinckiaceae bacterium]|jgi:assimilatory nitrate reductase catalytic subunit